MDSSLNLIFSILGVVISLVIALLIALVNHTLATHRDQMKTLITNQTCIDKKLVRVTMIIGLCHPEVKDMMKSQSPVELQLDPEYRALLEKYINEGVGNE